MRYQLIISYDGTLYAGWQVQANAKAIQPTIQRALETVLRHPVALSGSGRTDAGVHALAQSAHFDTPVTLAPHRLRLSLNALLPHDIRILEIHPVESDFHARYSAKSKIYHYHLHLDPISDPFTMRYRHHVPGRFDRDKLQKAIPCFLGSHDFSSFANTKDVPLEDSVRTIDRIDVVEIEGGLRLEFEGNGFLYKMVRNIVGALLDAAASKITPEEIREIFEKKDRRSARFAAPAKGLFLAKVVY